MIVVLKCAASLVLLPISKETSLGSIFARVWCFVPSRTCLAGLSAISYKTNCIYVLLSRVACCVNFRVGVGSRELLVLERGGVEGLLPSFMTAVVSFKALFFHLSYADHGAFGINGDVMRCSPKGIWPWVTSSAGRRRSLPIWVRS